MNTTKRDDEQNSAGAETIESRRLDKVEELLRNDCEIDFGMWSGKQYCRIYDTEDECYEGIDLRDALDAALIAESSPKAGDSACEVSKP